MFNFLIFYFIYFILLYLPEFEKFIIFDIDDNMMILL